MRFKGHNFTRTRKCVLMNPDEITDEEFREAGYEDNTIDYIRSKSYCLFGRVAEEGDEGAKPTSWKWNDGSTTYATLVPCNGYSLSNMMYGADGYMYLCFDMQLFVCAFDKVEVRYLRVEETDSDYERNIKVVARHRSKSAAEKALKDGQEVLAVRGQLGGDLWDRAECRHLPKKGDYTSRDYLANVTLEDR